MAFEYDEDDVGTDGPAIAQLGDDAFEGGGPFGDWRDEVSAADVDDWTNKTIPERIAVAQTAQAAL